MAKKGYTPEQIINKLREAEIHLSQGATIAIVSKKIEEEVRKMLAEARERDEEEDRLFGKDSRGDEMPEELKDRRSRLARLKEILMDYSRVVGDMTTLLPDIFSIYILNTITK